MSDSTGRLEELRERLGNAPDEARDAVATGSESGLVAALDLCELARRAPRHTLLGVTQEPVGPPRCIQDQGSILDRRQLCNGLRAALSPRA